MQFVKRVMVDALPKEHSLNSVIYKGQPSFTIVALGIVHMYLSAKGT